MKKLFILLVLISVGASAQEKTFSTQEVSVNEFLDGTLYTPNIPEKTNLVILIAGSGPTNRNGNQVGMKNNSLRFLAQSLAENGISVYSYDKRLFSLLKSGDFDESKLLFDDFITDASDVVSYFRKENQYNKIIIVGHSEGSLIGMMAAKASKANGFVSIAGAGNPIDQVLEFQISQNAPFLLEQTKEVLQELKAGNMVEVKNAALLSLFRESVQPYMISWLTYNPQDEIKKLNIPVMIINGTADLQVTVSEAELLKKARPEAKYLIITDMNHVLKEVKDDTENQQSYTNPDLPVAAELIQGISDFVNTL